MKITEALLAKHVVFHNLFDHLEGALPNAATVGEVRAMRDIMTAMLGAHGQVEHSLLLDPLEHCIDHLGQSETFHHEHEEIDRLLEDVTDTDDLDRARRRLLTAVLLAREHFDKEERLVFPLAEKHLTDKTLAELGLKWQQEHKAIVPVKEV
mgnify:CR=1 FL=1